MNSLIFFFVKARAWILLSLYLIVSLALVVTQNPYQHSVFMTSANSLSRTIYNGAANVTGYFNLRDINFDLQTRNASLEREVLALRKELATYTDSSYAMSHPIDTALARYDFILGHVINNSLYHPHNYITISKGSLDGIRPDMGVVDQNGIIGKVNVVGPHSARIISLLNDNLRVSAKIKGSSTIGSLVWDGRDYRYALLEEIPRHALFNKGDTLVTSGYSTTFPEGVPIGCIDGEQKDHDDNFRTLRIRLFTDFSKISTVRIIVDKMADELNALEFATTETDKQ